MLALETVPDADEGKAPVAAVARLGVPAWLTYNVVGDRTRAGQSLADAFAVAADVPEVVAVDVNCCGGSGVYDDDGVRQVFCSIVGSDECDNPNIARTMHLFQEWVPKDYEVRLTVVDGQFFAARIDGKSDAAHVDWRTDYDNLSYQAVETPNFVRWRVSALLDKLGLRFGALDFVVAPDGEWFLECNPNGQWAWIEDETEMPIASALAEALEGSSKRDGH